MMTTEPDGTMPEPLTEELLAQLLSLDKPVELDSFLQTQTSVELDLAQYLAQMLATQGLTKSAVVNSSGLNHTFAYQIFAGTRKPSRDKVLQLACALRLNLAQTQHLLKCAGANELYSKSRRDAIIIFCLTHDYNIFQTDEELYRFGEPTIISAEPA
jgi:cyanate lyase